MGIWGEVLERKYSQVLRQRPEVRAIVNSGQRVQQSFKRREGPIPVDAHEGIESVPYASQWVAVKYRWRLSVDKREKRALKRQLNKCSAKQLKVTKPARASIGKGSTGGHDPGTNSTDRRYNYCYNLKAAGL